MRSKFIFPVLLGVALLVGGLALKAYRTRLESELALAEHRARQARLTREIQGAQQQLDALAKAAALARTQPVRATTPPAQVVRLSGVGIGANSPALIAPDIATRLERLKNDPTVQNQHLAGLRRRYREAYRPFIRLQQLTPEQGERLIELLVEQDARGMDLSATAEKMALDAATSGKLMEENRAAAHAAKVALLGEEGTEKLAFYQRTSELRRFVDHLAGSAAVAGAPLTETQAESLVTAMASLPSQAQLPSELSHAEWNQVFAMAAAALPEAQFAAFKTAATIHRNTARLQELAGKKSE